MIVVLKERSMRMILKQYKHPGYTKTWHHTKARLSQIERKNVGYTQRKINVADP
jgi:hypothetical protein